MFKFVQEIEHVDFVDAVEQLAAKAGIQLRYTTGGESKERQRRKRLVEAMAQGRRLVPRPAADQSPMPRAARDYLRRRGLAGDVARQFKLGWAPDDWDALSRDLAPARRRAARRRAWRSPTRRNRMQDSFRARVMFPILTENGDAGRVRWADPARLAPTRPKYKNSRGDRRSTPSRRRCTASTGPRRDIVAADQVIVCEGYTDVIGFHRAGMPRAVATCGTALTEEHVRMLKRFASRVVLAFDADAAGQGAAERFYEWEQQHQVEVSVAAFPQGQGPGRAQPAAIRTRLRRPSTTALPFLGFRLQRVLGGHAAAHRPKIAPGWPSRRWRSSTSTPTPTSASCTPGRSPATPACRCNDMVAHRRRGARRPPGRARPPARRVGAAENAEFVAIALLLQRWHDMAGWLDEVLFVDDVARRAFLAVAEGDGSVERSLELADPEAAS